MEQKKLRLVTVSLLLSFVMITVSCASNSAGLRPVEREQIENVVKDYVIRDTNIPDYEVRIEEVVDNWARVSLRPAGVEGEPTILYLQKQVGVPEAPTAEATVQPGHTARVEATSGWAIILGPQAHFTSEELDKADIPPTIRS